MDFFLHPPNPNSTSSFINIRWHKHWVRDIFDALFLNIRSVVVVVRFIFEMALIGWPSSNQLFAIDLN